MCIFSFKKSTFFCLRDSYLIIFSLISFRCVLIELQSFAFDSVLLFNYDINLDGLLDW